MRTSMCMIFLILQLKVFCQSFPIPSNQMVSLAVGPSFHGSGDLPGVHFSVDYNRYFKKNLYYSIGIGGTIHNKQREIIFTSPNGSQHDGSIRSTTAGMQVVANLGFNIVRNFHHDLSLSAGPLFRYQSSSHYDDVTILYPVATGLPVPVIVYNHEEPQNAFSPGFNVQIAYSYFIFKQYSIGLLGKFQLDTNGDNIMGGAISLGKRF